MVEYGWDHINDNLTKEDKKSKKRKDNEIEYQRVKKIYMVSTLAIVYGYLNFAKNPFRPEVNSN